MLKRFLVALALVVFATEANAGAIGSVFQANTYKPGRQDRPAVTGLSGGGFVVTWESFGQDGYYFGIYGQKYTAAGQRLGGEFKINTEWRAQQFGSSVTGLRDGGFVVTWFSQYPYGSGPGIYGQRYDSAGKRLGREFQIGKMTPGWHLTSSVASLRNGGFAVAWETDNPGGRGSLMVAQRYNAVTQPVGNRVEAGITQQGIKTHSNAKVAGLADGGFVVLWKSDFGHRGIFVKRYNSSGVLIGGEILVEPFPSIFTEIDEVHVAGLKGGGFVVTWMNHHGLPTGNPHIFGRRYTFAGAPSGPKFRIDTVGGCYGAEVTALADGGFIVVYKSGILDAIYGQRYDSLGRRVGPELEIAPTMSVSNYYPVVTGLKDNGFVTVWTGREYDFFVDEDGTYGQRFGP